MTIWVVAGDQTWSERDAGCWSTPSTLPRTSAQSLTE
jgi:hypothetical protein